MQLYTDRSDAGRKLSEFLSQYNESRNTVVLGLPRGGVVVAYEIAKLLHLDLDVFLVRKLGVPYQPELAMGAIAEGGEKFLNEDVVSIVGVSQKQIDQIAEEEYAELKRRLARYRENRQALQIKDNIVIIADDGLATGATMKAAVRAIRKQSPQKIVVAVPVGASSTVAQLKAEADEVICPRQPENFMAVGMWYEQFEQTQDQEVVDLLKKSRIKRE